MAILLAAGAARAEWNVVIDPGHGGTSIVDESSPNNAEFPVRSQRGAGEKARFYEKHLALKFGTAIAAHINARTQSTRVKAILTRTTDQNVGMKDRAAVALDHDAKAFVSIHFNASETHTARGPAFFVQHSQHGNRHMDRDEAFGKRLADAVSSVSKQYDKKSVTRAALNDLKFKDGAGSFLFRYLRSSEKGQSIPACFLEIDFLDNPEVVQWLLLRPDAEAIHDQIAKSVADAVIKYVEEKHGR